MIEIRHLRAFLEIMRHGSTTGAARALGVSQPSVSRLLSQFEDARGETLFTRANGRLIARPRAEMLLPEVERTLSSLDGMLGAGGARGTHLAIAAPVGIVKAVFSPACCRLMAEFPDLRLSAEIMSYYDTLNAVAMGRADVGIVKAPVDHPAVCAIPLATVGTEVVMPEGHPLSTLAEISPSHLAGEPLVLLGRHRPFRVQLEQVLEQVGVTPRVVIETHAVSAACSFVARGMGVTVANAVLARFEAQNGLTTRPFRADIRHGFCLIHSRRPRQQNLIGELLGQVRRELDALL